MARNGSGGYALPINGWNPAVNGVSATPADWQALINDVAAAIQASVAADGQTPMTGNLQMGGYRLTGAGAPSGARQSLRWEQLTRGADIPSAATIAIPLEGQLFAVTGSTAITAINATIAGRLVYLKFDAGIVLTHSASLLMPSGVNVTTGADDVAVFVSVSAGVWRCVSYPRFEAADYPSATGPTITWPYMTWADTGNMLLKRRNAAGTAWVTIGPLLKATLPQYALADIPTTDQGDIWVTGVGGYEWDGAAYAPTRNYLPGEVIQQVYFADVGAATKNESYVSMQVSSFVFTPKSTNSKIHIQYTFDGSINAVSGVFTVANYQVVQSAPSAANLSQIYTLQGYYFAAGYVGVEAPCALTCDEISNSSLSARTFALYGKASGSSGTAENIASFIRVLVTEVQA